AGPLERRGVGFAAPVDLYPIELVLRTAVMGLRGGNTWVSIFGRVFFTLCFELTTGGGLPLSDPSRPVVVHPGVPVGYTCRGGRRNGLPVRCFVSAPHLPDYPCPRRCVRPDQRDLADNIVFDVGDVAFPHV